MKIIKRFQIKEKKIKVLYIVDPVTNNFVAADIED